MSALLRSELLKVRTVRTYLWLLLASVVLVVIASISVSASTGSIGSAADDRSVAQIAAMMKQAQPARNASPPSGVMAPSTVAPVRASA